MQLFCFALLAVLGSLALPAEADLLPPDGRKRVAYEAEVTSIPASKDVKLVIFPWSSSNGRPTADIKIVEPHKPVRFGRAILGGTPKFWAVHIDQLENIDAVRIPDDPFKTASALKDWIKSPNIAIQCSGAEISTRFEASEDSPAKFVDKFVVKSLSPASCIVQGSLQTESKADFETGARNYSRLTGKGVSASWAFSVMAISAVSVMVWRLSTVVQRNGQSSTQVDQNIRPVAE